jgi:threonine synthase
MGNVAYLECTICGAQYPAASAGPGEAPQTPRYVCPKHGAKGILDTVLDYERIGAATSPSIISESRDYSIWRYSDLLPLEDARLSAPPLQVGWTPLYHASNLGSKVGLANLFVKDDGRNPTASFKDRASAVVVAKARELGVKTITTASSGNAGAALAGLAAAAKMPAVIFVPQTAPQAKVAQLLMFGAQVLLVRGTYDQAFDLCLAASEEFGWYCRNTAYNPYTVEGKKTASFEICEQFSRIRPALALKGRSTNALSAAKSDQRESQWDGRSGNSQTESTRRQISPNGKWHAPDRIFVSVGDGNIISGLWKGLRDLASLGWIDGMPRLMGVQAAGSAACYDAWRTGAIEVSPVDAHTIADSISVGVPRDGRRAVRAVRETGGAYLTVTDDEILAAMRDLARDAAVFAEPAGAAAYAGVAKSVREGMLKSDETVVCLVTGNGLKDIASAMKAAGEPRLIEPTLDAVRQVVG